MPRPTCFKALLGGFLAAILFGGSARADDQVWVSAGEHGDTGRIVFSWPKRAMYNAHVNGDQLEIEFDRPFQGDLDKISKRLPRYVKDVTIGADGKKLTATLKQPVTLKTFAEDKVVGIDLLTQPDRKFAPTAQAAPQAAAPAEAKPPETKPAEPKAAEAKPEEAKPEAASEAKTKAEAKPETKPEAKAEFRTRSSRHDARQSRAERRAAKAVAKAAAKAAARESAKAAASKALAKTQPNKIPATKPEPTKAEAKAAEKAAVVPPQPLAQAASPPPPPVFAPVPAAPPPAAPAPQPQAPVKPSIPEQAQLTVAYAPVDEGASLRFEWQRPVGAAIFRRNADLWIVFGAPLPADLQDVQKKGAEIVTEIEQVPNAEATVFRLRTVAGVNPSVRRSENAWIVDLVPQMLGPEAPIPVLVQPGRQPSRVLFEVGDATAPVSVQDPEVGDTLTVVPVRGLGQGVAQEESFVEFHTLLTIQGIVVRLVADQIEVKSSGEGVEVAGPSGLVLSSEIDRSMPRSGGAGRFFNLADWAGRMDGDFLTERGELEHAIVAATPSSRSDARLDLARFYFARGHAAEAKGVIAAIERNDPTLGSEPGVRAVAGAIALQMNDLKAATRDLNGSALDAEIEIGLWRGALAAREHDWKRAHEQFSRADVLLSTYPKPLRTKFRLAAGEAALNVGEYDDARRLFEAVREDAPLNGDMAAVRYFTGKALQLRGDSENALATWDKLATSLIDRQYRARAAFSAVTLRLEAGKITRAEAIKKLDELRYSWRGDDFEVDLLRRLAELKIEEGDYRGGFDAMRQLVAYFPENRDAPAIRKEFVDAFAGIFVGPGAENVPPLKAVALYEENRDLLPEGERGNEIIRRLSDRLVAVDLLDRAARLIEEEVKTRLQGRDKARVSTRLTLLRLLDGKPKAALDALAIDVGPVDGELQRQRLQLQAQALIELNQNDEALKLIVNDTSRDADRLRAGIAWRGRNWPEASRILARLAPNPEAGAGLEDDGAHDVLNWATALTLAGDKKSLTEVTKKYAAAMEKSRYKAAFHILAATDGTASDDDFRDVVGKVAQIEDFRTFLSDYRQQLSGKKLSSLN